MSGGVYIEGLDEALERLDAEIGKIQGLAQAGLWEAGLQTMRASQKRLTAQIYSKGSQGGYRLTGNLRASGYVRANAATTRPAGDKLIGSQNESVPSDKLPPIGVELGYTAVYALYVHEDMEGRGAKFLENVILENEAEIIEIVKKRSGADG